MIVAVVVVNNSVGSLTIKTSNGKEQFSEAHLQVRFNVRCVNSPCVFNVRLLLEFFKLMLKSMWLNWSYFESQLNEKPHWNWIANCGHWNRFCKHTLSFIFVFSSNFYATKIVGISRIRTQTSKYKASTLTTTQQTYFAKMSPKKTSVSGTVLLIIASLLLTTLSDVVRCDVFTNPLQLFDLFRGNLKIFDAVQKLTFARTYNKEFRR